MRRRTILTVSALIMALLLTGLLVACSSGEETTTTVAPETTTTVAGETTTTVTGDTTATTVAGEIGGVGEGYKGAPRTYLFSPVENVMVDTSKYKKDPPYVVGFSNASISNVWRVSMQHEVMYHAWLNKDKISKLIITDANDDPTKQIADIQDLLSRGVDILIVSAAQSGALSPIIDKATESGVPVVMVDRRVDSENFVTFVSSSDLLIGRVNMQWLCESLNGQGNVVMLPGLAGASPAEIRIKGAKEVLATFPNVKLLELQYTDWSPTKGKQVMSALIQKYGKDIQGVWCDSSLQGSGAVEAFLDAGYADEDIPFFTGGDTNRHAQLAVEHGIPTCWVNFPPTMGGIAVDVAVNMVLAGAAVPHLYEINTDIVVSKGYETPSVSMPDYYMEDYAKMDAPGDLSLSLDIPLPYDPATWSIDYPK